MSAPKIPELATRRDGRDRAGTTFLTAERCEDGPRSRRVLAGSPQATSHGIDERPVVTHSEPVSMSRETTFDRDLHAKRDRTDDDATVAHSAAQLDLHRLVHALDGLYDLFVRLF